MKNEFLEYFKSIGIREPVFPRIETIMEYFSRLLPDEEVMDVYISDYVELDGARKYEDLRLIGKERSLIATDFMSKDEFHIAKNMGRVVTLKIEAKDYDFRRATDKSRLHVWKFYPYQALGEYKASMNNCDYLMRICEKYLLPYLASE
jgi:hypothetical protein